MRILTAFLFFLLGCRTAQAQFFPDEIKFTNYTRADGLPDEHINSLVQDSRGFLWIGSSEGLFRFDGLHFKAWYANPNDSTKFSSNNVVVIDEYKPGVLLFYSQYRLWEINIANHRQQPVRALGNQAVFAVPVRINNREWCTASRDTLYILDESFSVTSRTYIRPLVVEDGAISCLPLHHPYMLLFTAGHNNFHVFNCQTKTTTPVNIDVSRLEPRARFFWPRSYDSTQKRLYLSAYFDGNFYTDLALPVQQQYSPVKINALPDGAVLHTLLLPDGQVMQGGQNGLYITDFKATRYYHTSTPTDKPIANNVVLRILRDKENDFWLGTGGGISRFSLKPPAFRYWKKELGLMADDEFKAFIHGPEGELFFHTMNNSLWRLDKNTHTASQLDKSLLYCWSAIKDGNSILATGSGKKLIRYNFQDGKITHPAFLQPFYSDITDIVTLAFKAKNGDRWFSCNGRAGLIKNPAGTNRFIQYKNSSVPPAFTHSYLHCAAEDSKGNIWFGTNRSGRLLKWNAGSDRFSEFSVDSLIPQSRLLAGVNYLFSDHADNLWIALDNGALLKYHAESGKGAYYDINNGLPTNTVNSICTDAKNRIWIGTSKGLSCYLPASERFITFTSKDGMPEDNLPGSGILFDEEENRIYVGGKRTIASFNPDTLLQNIVSVKPPVFIDEISVNGKPLYFTPGRKAILSPSENNIEFGFSVPDFNRNSQLVFQYQLKGAGAEWIDLGDKRSVTFNNLASGNYVLAVRCKYNGSDNWTETPQPFSFEIGTPWFKTWWFITLILLGAGLLAWRLIRSYYRRKLEKQKMLIEKELAIEQERTRMARELHDGLGSMLSGIKHSFSAIEKQLSLDTTNQLKFHNNIEKLNESIVQLRNIAHSMATDSSLQFGLENALRDYCRSISQLSGTVITFSAVGTAAMKLTEEQSFHSFRIIQELLQNISKHAGAKEAIVQISYHDKHFHIAVEDDGKGFTIAEARQAGGMGLKNIESRVQILKGHMDFQSVPGKGTSVLIDIDCS